MFRYLALQWSSADPAPTGQAERLTLRLRHEMTGWRQVFSAGGLVVFVTGEGRGACTTYPLGDGVVIGTLFRLCDTQEGKYDLYLDRAQCESICRSGGRELVDLYWGRYVAFLRDASLHETIVVRDPTGAMPCLWVESNGVRIFFSVFEDCLELAPRRFSINWTTIAIRLSVVLIHKEQSELNEVEELRAGECICFGKDSCSRRFYWNPVVIAGGLQIAEPAVAIAEMQHTTRMCVRAWASRYRGIIHYLSGGLDSAIVLGALAGVADSPPVCSLNYYSPGTDGDERRFARIAAHRFGCKLIEQARSETVDLRGILGARRTPGPRSLFVRLEPSRHEARLAASTGADGFFSGDGGDVLFFRTPAAMAAADYVYDHGLSLRALEVGFNAACLDECSFWSTLHDMWHYGVKRRRQHSILEHRADWGAVSADVVEAVTRRGDFAHPWFRNGIELPPGKLGQAFLLSFAADFDDPLGDYEQPEHTCPLLSQPLLELCLRIPTYVLAPGPLDRMLARRAFAADLPAEILRRRAKGGVAQHLKDVLESNREFLTEFLLDGVLVNQHLLDRAKLIAALSSAPSRDKYWVPEIFEYAAIEAWAGCWV